MGYENLYIVSVLEPESGHRVDGQITVASRELTAKITRGDLPRSIGTSFLHFDSTIPEGEWVKVENLGVEYKRVVSV